MSSLVSFRRFCIPVSTAVLKTQKFSTPYHFKKIILLQQQNQLSVTFFGVRYLSSKKDTFSDFVEGVKATGQELKDKAADGAEVIKEKLADIPGKVKETIEAAKDSEYSKKGKEFVENIAETVTEKAQSVGAKTVEGAEKIKEQLSGKVSETLENVKHSEYAKKGQQVASEASESITDAVKKAGAKVAEGAEKVKEKLSEFPEKAKEKYNEAKNSEYAKKGHKFVSDAAEEVTKKYKKTSKQHKKDDDD